MFLLSDRSQIKYCFLILGAELLFHAIRSIPYVAAYAEDLQTSPKQGIKVNYLVHNSQGICAWGEVKELSSVSMEMAILGTHHA